MRTGGLAMTLIVVLAASALAQNGRGQHRNGRADQYGGSLDARQHGYEHAYRDGADRGREDRDRGADYNPNSPGAKNSAKDYEGFFGNRGQYMKGAREGYRAGYDDGYNGRYGRYGQLYGRQVEDDQVSTRDDAYANRSWGSADMAFDVGYRDGVTAGQQDQRRNTRPDYRNSDAYQNADLGYRASYGDRNAYRLQFREGFDRGYQDGYGRARYSGGGVDATQGTPARTLVVQGNTPWTSTGIRVNQGDTMRVRTSGEIRFTSDANDRASAAGSLERKRVPGAPLPGALAGALIGRVDNGQPFGIGNQTSIRMPANGTLYLGINDDYVSDNTGQFQVDISR